VIANAATLAEINLSLVNAEMTASAAHRAALRARKLAAAALRVETANAALLVEIRARNANAKEIVNAAAVARKRHQLDQLATAKAIVNAAELAQM